MVPWYSPELFTPRNDDISKTRIFGFWILCYVFDELKITIFLNFRRRLAGAQGSKKMKNRSNEFFCIQTWIETHIKSDVGGHTRLRTCVLLGFHRFLGQKKKS